MPSVRSQNIKYVHAFKKRVLFIWRVIILEEQCLTRYVKCQKAQVIKHLTKIREWRSFHWWCKRMPGEWEEEENIWNVRRSPFSMVWNPTLEAPLKLLTANYVALCKSISHLNLILSILTVRAVMKSEAQDQYLRKSNQNTHSWEEIKLEEPKCPGESICKPVDQPISRNSSGTSIVEF